MPVQRSLFDQHPSVPPAFLLRLDELTDEADRLRLEIESDDQVTRMQRRIAVAIVTEVEALLDEVEQCL